MAKAVFKTYAPNQLQLLPPTWEEKIDKAHPVRVVDKVIEQLDLTKLYDSYEGGNCSAYHLRPTRKRWQSSWRNCGNMLNGWLVKN